MNKAEITKFMVFTFLEFLLSLGIDDAARIFLAEKMTLAEVLFRIWLVELRNRTLKLKELS